MWEYLGSGMWKRVANPDTAAWTNEEIKAWHQDLIRELDEAVAKQQKESA